MACKVPNFVHKLAMPEIALPKGLVAIVDEDDLARVAERTWHARKSGGRNYAATKTMRGGRTELTYLHRFILDSESERIGFRNGNSLDCRRANLHVIGHASPAKTFQRGSLGEAMVIADLAKHGHDVFVPIAGHTAADLISVRGSGPPIRWQVKFRSMVKGSSSLSVSLSGIQPLKGGFLRKPYDLDAIDGFAIFCPNPEGVFYIPIADIDRSKGSFTICLGPNAHGSAARDGLKYIDPNIL